MAMSLLSDITASFVSFDTGIKSPNFSGLDIVKITFCIE